MKKIIITSLLLLTTACASTSDINTLQSEIDTLRHNQVTLEKNVENVKTACDLKHAQCIEHCKAVDSKLDRVFKKSQHK